LTCTISRRLASGPCFRVGANSRSEHSLLVALSRPG
jgi:hypothetical protein